MNFIGRLMAVCNWLMFGKDEENKKKIVSFIELVLKEGKNVELAANKKGEITLRFRKEF